MARRLGNYVSGVGSGTNWASGISQSLTDLSRSLISQGQAEDERARLAAKEAEDTRRYQDTLARQKRLDDFQQSEAQATRDWRKTQAEENQRRWQAEQDIAKAERKRLEEERKRAEEERIAATQLSWDLRNNPVQFTIDDYATIAPETARSLTNTISGISGERDATLAFLSGTEANQDRMDQAVSAYEDNLRRNTNLNDLQVQELVTKRNNELLGLQNELASLNPQARENRLGQLRNRLYDSRIDEINTQIGRGVGLGRQERLDIALNRLTPDQQRLLTSSQASEILSPQFKGQTTAEMRAAEAARVKAANEEALKDIELYDKYLLRANAGTKAYEKSSKGVAAALKDIGGIDIGPLDTADAREGFDLMVNTHNVSPAIAAAAIRFGIDKGLVEDSFPSPDSKEFAELVVMAQDLQGSSSTDPNTGRVTVDPTRYVLNREKAKGLPTLRQSQFRFSPVTDRSLGVSRDFLPTPQVNVLPGATNVPLPPGTSTQLPPNTAADLPSDVPSVGATTIPEGITRQQLDELLGDRLDLGRSVAPRNPRSMAGRTPVQQASFDITQVQDRIDALRSQLDRGTIAGRPITASARRRINQDLLDLRADRNSIYDRLVKLQSNR